MGSPGIDTSRAAAGVSVMKPMSGGTTSQLTDAARSGSREAFEALLRPLIEPGCQLAFGILGDWQEAEDAVQEASMRAWRYANMSFIHTAAVGQPLAISPP